jgi:phosphate-selective porin OprO and OprP
MKNFILLIWLAVSFFVLSALSFAAETDVDRLLDLLVEKGVVTKDDAAGFRADLAVKKQEEKETQKEFTVIASKPIKISGYTQLRYRNDKSTNDTFDIRRARFNLQGDITERFDYRTQVEFGGTAVTLLDAIIGYKVNPYLKLILGQTFVPFSQENLVSNTKLETINRSQIVEATAGRSTNDILGNKNGRDIGIQASGSILPKADYNLFDYVFGIFNGAGTNVSADTNEQKDYVGRLVFHPIKTWSIGSSYYAGSYAATTTSSNVDRDRYGLEFAYVEDPVSFKGEYIKGHDGTTDKDGWYLQAGYYFIPKKFQGVLKFDTYDPDTNVDKNEKDVYTLGGNWYFNKSAFLQVNYEFKDEKAKETDNNALTGQLTLQF